MTLQSTGRCAIKPRSAVDLYFGFLLGTSMGNHAYVIPSNLSERQIESDVASYVGWVSPDGQAPFRLLDVNEQLTGADRRFDCAQLIFLQFKKSRGLRSIDDVPKGRGRPGALDRIRRFRNRYQLGDSPTLFFQLREKAEGAEDYQHNVLMNHHRPTLSFAAYVAPLVLDSAAYSKVLFDSAFRYMEYPLWFAMREPIVQAKWSSLLGFVPFLRAHVSIVPHERVDTHEHYYAYSCAGTDVSWHSESVVTREPSRFGDFLKERIHSFTSRQYAECSLPRVMENARMIAKKVGLSVERDKGRHALDVLQLYGQRLRDVHGIRMLLLAGKCEELSRRAET